MTEANFEGGHPGPEWLSAWHDGELHDEAATAVRQHLDGCTACRHLLDEIRQIDQAARLADDAAPDPAAWEAIEGRLRQRLEDELGLGIPVGAAARYVETDADLVLRPSLAEVKGGKGARPFRLRWAVATAAGLGLGLFTLRTLSDNGWTVSRVMDPAVGRRYEAPVATPPQESVDVGQAEEKARTRETAAPPAPAPTAAKEASVGAEMSANQAASPPADGAERGNTPKDAREEVVNQARLADASAPTMAAADRYLADVELTLRSKGSPDLEGTTAQANFERKKDEAAPPAALSSPATSGQRADADDSGKMKAAMNVEPEYAAVFAAASRARESGEYALARRGFDLVAGAVPDEPLARDAEFEARLAQAHADIAGGQSFEGVRSALEREATSAWDAALTGSRPECRRALALWRAIGALDEEQGRSTAQRDIEERVARLKTCAD